MFSTLWLFWLAACAIVWIAAARDVWSVLLCVGLTVPQTILLWRWQSGIDAGPGDQP